MQRPKILVIGSTNIDMVVQAQALPTPGQTVLGDAFTMTPGGKGANQAVAAARAGGDVAFITAVGDDAFGAESRDRFLREGINIDHLLVKHGAATGVALIVVDTAGENQICVAPGANALLDEDDLVKASPAFIGMQAVVMQLETPLPTIEWAARFAAKLGCAVILNPAPMPPGGLPNSLLRCVDILTPNVGELLALAPGASTLEEAAAAVLARGPKAVAVTQGARGVTLFMHDAAQFVPAFPVQAVDTVGAGDCFAAALTVACAEGRTLREAGRFAAAAAALSTTASGAQQSMPTREMIEEYLAGAPLAL